MAAAAAAEVRAIEDMAVCPSVLYGSSTTTLTKNGKTYHWCTGPSHQKIGMWVIHEAGTCNASTTKCTSGTPEANVTTQSGTPPALGNKGKNKFKAHLAQALANHNTFGDDTSKLIKEIMDKYK